MHDEEWDETTKRQEFEKLVRANQTGLLGFLVSLTGNLADSEDLAQECITVLWKKFNEFEKGTNFGAWARSTAFFLFKNHSRKGFAKKMTFDTDIMERLASMENIFHDSRSSRLQFLSECLSEINDKERDLILSRYEPGRTVADLAAQLGCNVKSVYNSLARIRLILAECMKRKQSETEGGIG